MTSLKLFGFILLLLFALLLGRAYSAYAKRRTLECESFLLLIGHIREGISLFLSTPAELFSSYEDELLMSSGFLTAVREGEEVSSAFEHSKGSLALSEEVKKRLSLFFSEFGKSYKDGELKRCELFEEELRRAAELEREREPERIKLGYTLLFSAALALIIFLI